MKKEYIRPYIEGEEFLPNEYVAVCYYIGCDVMGNDWNGLPHNANGDGTGCGHPENQVITENPDGSIAITEVNTDGIGILKGTITNSDWNPISMKDVKAGDEIYWTTSDATRTWYHHGHAVAYNGSHPNHS